MVKTVQLGLRAFQFFMALLILACMGNAVAMGASPSINNYTLFSASFAMLALVFLIPVALEIFTTFALAAFALDAINVLFWFCAAVALAAQLDVHSCNNKSYTASNIVTRGASDRSGACREAQASCAFLWFGWVAFVASAILSGITVRGGSIPHVGGIRPAMSQRSAV